MDKGINCVHLVLVLEKMKMKALITTHAQMFCAPDGSIWADSVYGYDFFKRYLEVFEEIRVVTRMKSISFDEIGNKIRADGKGVEFYKLPFYHGPWQYIMNITKIQMRLSAAIIGCDCAILRIPDQLSFQLFNKIKKAKIPCGVEVVAHSWDLFSPGTIKTVLRPFLRILWDILQKRTCRKADGVSYVTESYIQKRYPSNIKKDKNRFETFYTSANIDKNFFYRVRNLEEFSNDPFTIIHVAGINNTSKGHKELLNSINEIKKSGKNLKVTFIGGGTLLEYFRDMANTLGLTNQVNFVGHINSKNEIINYLAKSDLFVFPTMTEGLPRVLIEAMATGLPCIATNVGGIPELLSSNAIVNPNDVSGLTMKIMEFISNNDLLVEESRKNFNKAILYSNETIQKKRNKFYLDIKALIKQRINLN
jgi:L-malate glycosyltransferase